MSECFDYQCLVSMLALQKSARFLVMIVILNSRIFYCSKGLKPLRSLRVRDECSRGRNFAQSTESGLQPMTDGFVNIE